jgi:uncharacterized membrane protein
MFAWEKQLNRWQEAGLIDDAAASRIRDFEARTPGLRWPAVAAVSFGAIMLMAGVLLFVSAHWDELGPSTRFAMVVAMVAVFHAAGAWAATRMEPLAMALHGIGTVLLGAGIFLSGQIFNMEAHWPAGMMLWAVGAWIGYALRLDWVQMSLAAILTPAWIGAEWMDAHPSAYIARVLSQGILLLAIVYFTAPKSRALVWIGGIAVLPAALALILGREFGDPATAAESGEAYGLAYLLPLGVALLLRGKLAWMNSVAALWVLVLSLASRNVNSPLIYLWCLLGSLGLVAWGMHERRTERVNVAMAGFALTVLFFYFSSVMDKIGRSASLIGLGVLFLAGGFGLEMVRRRLVRQLNALARVSG